MQENKKEMKSEAKKRNQEWRNPTERKRRGRTKLCTIVKDLKIVVIKSYKYGKNMRMNKENL